MRFKSRLLGASILATIGAAALPAGAAHAQEATASRQQMVVLDIPAGPASTGLNTLATQADVQLFYPFGLVSGRTLPAIKGEYAREDAIRLVAEAAGLNVTRKGEAYALEDPQSGSANDGADGTVEALIVTAQKREEDIQDVPIAISAFTQEALERSQVAGGPDLMTQVPNMTFTKTNFTGYSIQLRGVGTQAISATTDAAVAVAFNNTPFIRNRFFEQEFYDLQRVEVLRGPQGTLYGRNATAGVVNLISQKPKFAYEAKLSGDISNYSSTRLEGMLNVPLVEDKVALRLAGAWTKREGYSTNQITGNPIDGRDLWSTRLSLRVSPTDAIDVNLVWEHFEEDDDRLRSGKQLCHQDDRTQIGDLKVGKRGYSNLFSQGCLASSLYSPDSFEAPDGYSLPYYLPLKELGVPIKPEINPYVSLVQSPDLRMIESTVDPVYKAESNVVELQASFDISDSLTLASETGYSSDTIFSMEDYNRFNTASGVFNEVGNVSARPPFMHQNEAGNWEFCDPQIGCADRLVAVDVSTATSRQFSQEFRLSSNYDGNFNFSLGANFMRYDTEDKYYVFINTLTMMAAAGGTGVFATLPEYVPGQTDNRECLIHGQQPPDPRNFEMLSGCIYIDPNPISRLNDLGHNYFLSRNPYKLISYAVFGEAYYNLTDNLKVTAGLRWTVDKKEAPRIPSWLLGSMYAGYSVLNVEEQEWREPTGRLTVDWKPDLSFTDETLLYASYAHGYKAGGSNPPPSGIVTWSTEGNTPGGLVEQSAAKPKIFDPEFVDSFEVGAKNTLLDGRMTLNLAAFYYDYTGYQVSQIIDRSAVNYNFDSKIWGLEIEADWRPLENLRLAFKGGYEHTEIADGEHAIDIMDRTAGRTDWLVLRPFPSFPSNCVVPAAVFNLFQDNVATYGGQMFEGGNMGPCEYAYVLHLDPATLLPYQEDPEFAAAVFGGEIHPITERGWIDYHGYNPDADVGQNHGEGFFKELGGKKLPNAPHFTATITADYTVPLPHDWLATLHTDLYYQSEAWTRVFNTPGFDKMKAYTNVNLAAIFTNDEAGWKVMAYVKNVFDRDSITGAFLNSDDTGLTTNVFLTEPRLYGIRVTKDFDGGPWWTGASGTGPFPLWVELGGSVIRQDAPYQTLAPYFADAFSALTDPTVTQNRDQDWGDGREVRITYKPAGGAWSLAAAYRSGRSNKGVSRLHSTEQHPQVCGLRPDNFFAYICDPDGPKYITDFVRHSEDWSDQATGERESYELADFTLGRDVGLGGLERSTISGGLRVARLNSTTATRMDGVPNADLEIGWIDFNPYPVPFTFDQYRASIDAAREFQGAGPILSWDAATRLLGGQDTGHLNVEWSVGGGVLFGSQETQITGTTETAFTSVLFGNFPNTITTPTTVTPLGIDERSKSVSAPFLDLSLGLSYEIQRVQIGAGYRWERYFDVLDAGFEERGEFDRTIDGPYFKLAVGFGG